MINREINYERNMTGSYMKIPMGIHAGLDERLILQRKLPGTLPVEKAFVDGNGQYWYDISGKQSLDTYCRVREVGGEFVERLVISICSELEILEWNLIHSKCLMLDPELIFITNSNREFIFTLYPGNHSGIEAEFRQMMEFLLTKINHKESAAVRTAYAIYEKTLEDGYSLIDIRDSITQSRQREPDMAESCADRRVVPQPAATQKATPPEGDKMSESKPLPEKRKKEFTRTVNGKRILAEMWKYFRERFALPEGKKPASGRRIAEELPIVYPEEEICEPQEQIHPTICLTGYTGAPRGLLLYQGAEQMEDIRLEAKALRIGYGKDADIRIDRDTISQLHARIDRDGDSYYIEDLNSTNGTYVNEEALVYKERRQLKANDIVRFADIRYRFC